MPYVANVGDADPPRKEIWGIHSLKLTFSHLKMIYFSRDQFSGSLLVSGRVCSNWWNLNFQTQVKNLLVKMGSYVHLPQGELGEHQKCLKFQQPVTVVV